MNKIFKVVWSKSKNCYVVVSEFAKNNSGKKKTVVAAILAALAMTNASISMAANTLPTNMHATAVGLGDGASVTGDKAVGFGQNAAAAGGYSIAIGSNSSTSVNSPQGIAIGGGNTANEGARVIGEQAIAIGGNTIAQGNSSIVIGGDDVVKADGVKVIYTTNNGEIQTGDLRSAVQSLTGFDMRNPLYTTATAGESGITLGMKGQSGNVGIAIGTGANAKDRLSGPSGQANNDVTNAIAIGTGARANRDNAIAIGGGSNTDVGGTKQSSYTLPNNVVASWAGGDKTLPGDVVSFGSKGYERQLKHVAPGEVSATSTDAINGSQLSAIVDQIAYKYISIKSSDVANKDNTGATADNSIAIGPNAATDASASRSVAVGDGARGKVVDGVAVGSKSIADIASGVAGYNVNASRTDIYAGLSGAALTSKLGGVAVGTINQTRQINYVAAGTADTDAVNVAQLKSVNLAFTGDTGTGDVNLANSKLAVNGDNTYISTTANGKKITVSGKKQDITVANGSATATAGMADSANVANAINQAIDQNKYGWNLSANGEATPVAVEKGNTVDFSGGDNVAVARNDKKISVALKKDLSKLNSASFNNAGGNETVKIDGDKGINAGNLKVANVADGVADKDAVNVSQLKKVDDKAEANKTAIDTNKTAIAKNAGNIATNKDNIAANKADIAANTDKIGKNADAISDNKQKIADNKDAITKNASEIAINKGDIASNKANIAQNTAAIGRKIFLGGNSGSTDEKSLSTGDVKFNVKGENGLTTVANGDDVTVKLDDATKGKVDNAADRDLSNLTPNGKQQVKELAAWNVVANNETAEKVEGGNTVKFIDGDNISITQNGKDFTISTKKDVTFDTVTATQTITAPKVKATTGVETPQVTGLTNTAWVPGQTQPVSGRAATEDQLKHVDDQVAENKANIVDNTDKIGKNAVAIADNKQKIADNKTAIDKNAGNIATNKDNIAANKADIAANTDKIGKNADAISDNKQKIADNKDAITKNASEIAINKGDIASNKANIAQNTAAIGRKIFLGGNSGSTDEKSLSTGDVKFNVKGENGLTTVANGDDVTVKLDDTTKGKIDNATDRDLSNLTTDGKQQVKDLAAWNVVANNETAEKVEGGNTVKFIDGDNISITQNDKDFTISTKKDVTFDTVTANQTITAPKVKATTGVETPQVTGLTNTAWVPGQTQPVSGRAATEDQLKHVDDQVAENKANIADNTDKIGKNAHAIADNKQKIADNKTAIDKNIGDIATNKADIATNKANIDKNMTAIARKISLGGNSGSTDEKSLSTGDVKFNVKGENGLTTVANGDDVTVKLDDTTKGKIENAADQDLSNLTPDGKQQVKDLSAWNVVANDNTTQRVEGGNTVKFIDGDNISITQNGKDFTISTKKDVTFDTVTAIQTITAPKVKATTGVETPQVTGLTNTEWTPGQTQPVSGRAATEDQLKYVDDQVTKNKATIADNTDKIGKNADAIADNKQKIADNKTAIDKNAADITTNKDNIADNKQKIADNKTAIDKNTGDIATNKADISTNKDNIAINKANIDKNTTAIGRKISLGGNSGSTDEKSLSTGDVKFNVKGENGLTTVANGDDVTVKLDDATKGKVDNAADRDLSNLTPDGKQQVKDLAAWNVVANNEMAEKVEGGNTVKFIDGDNISITQNGKDFTISTKKDVTFDTVTATQTITAPKVKATTGVETPQVTGLTNTAWVPGQTQPVSGRAATEDQLKHVDDQVAENKATIADNTDKIGKNADAIADNKQKIADNKAAIDKNAVDIATNKDNIAANKTDIATNKDNIADNKQKIADNKTAITKNTDNIATNRQNIADNKAAITKNASDIVTNKDNIATNKANIDKNTTAIARKISLGGDSGSTDEKSLSTGDVKFNVKGENGLTTVANGDDVTVKLDDTTKGKIENAADQDLSNLTPDGKQQVKDLSAWNVVANDNTTQRVEGGNTVKFIDGDNISITQNGKDFTISTKKDVTFDTVTATQTITAPKVKATTGVETPQVTGLTNTAWVPGQTQPISGRAATEDQLKHVDDQVSENKAKIADNTDKIGKNAEAIADNKQKIADNKAAIDKNAVDIATNKDNIATNKADIATNKNNIATNKQNIADNKAAITKNAGDIATNKANIDKNTEAIGRKISLGGNTGSTDEKSLSTGDVKFNIKGQNGIVTEANGDDVTVKLDDATANKINNAANTDLSNLTDAGKQQVKDLSAWNVVANGNTAEKVEGGNTVKFIDGDNISITQNGKDFTIATKQDVTFNTVKANQTITAPKVKATEGVETPQVTGLTNTAWTPGQTQPVSGRAATEDQLKHVDDQVVENKANIADNTDKIGKNADAIADNKAAITKNTSDIATNKDNIATNKANINKNTTAIARKISLGGNSGLTDEKSLSTGDVKFNIKGENGLTTIANGEDVTVKIDDQTKAKIDNAANQDLSNLTDAGKQQVKDISAWKVTAAGGTVEKVQGGDTVKFQAGDNLVVNQDRTTFTYGLAKDLKGLNSVTVGDENGVSTKITPAGTTVKDAAGNSTTINGGGMTITPADTAASPVSLTVDGLNNGGNKIHGVAPGTADTDAVNVSQLKASNAGLQEAVNRVGTETQRVGAHAAAMAALKPIQYDPLEPTQIMAGIGNYRGETAGAIGIAHYRTEDTMFNVGVSLGTSHNMVNAGVTHKFGGSRERKDAIPERYKAGPISSVYVMQDEVSSLKKENSNQKTVIANQAARLNTLEAENERQRQELAETKQGLDDLRAVVNQLLASKG